MGVRGVHRGAADHLEGLSAARRAVVAGLCLLARAATADVTVTTTDDVDADDAACSLREAIVAASTDADYHGCVRSAATIDQIVFDLGAGTPSITVTGTELPRFSGPVVVDGATGGATRVEISGGGALGTGLSFLLGADATGSAIRNLVINGFTTRQLLVSNGSNMTIEGNILGLDPTGTAVKGTNGSGIETCDGFSCGTSAGHTIGGTTAAARNVIVAGDGSAIFLGGTSSCVIQGNFLNTDVTGSTNLGAPFVRGISIQNTNGTIIGGSAAGAGNVITGLIGIVIGGNPALQRSTGTVVQGNRIGTNASGTAGITGGGDGISLGHALDTMIGGPAVGAGNVISGFHDGVTGGSSGVSGGSVANTTVEGNLIGTDLTGTVAIGNSGIGVNLGDSATILDNVIAFSGSDGIEANCGSCVQRISGNAIHSNGGIGIDLNGGNPGVTPNDLTDDSDVGPNGLQNFPILDPVTFPGGTSIGGSLDSTPSTTFRVEIFASDACDPSGNGEGQQFVGANDGVTTAMNGDATFTVTLDQSVPAGKIMTATAIAPDGSTSEFSPCTPAPPTTTTTTTTTSTSSEAPTTSSTSTTIAPTTTSSTAPVPTTTSSSTTSAPVPTTTSSTSTPSPTTTSTTLAGCDGVPDGATFASIECRLAALLEHVNGEPDLGSFGPKLAHSVEKARGRTADAESACRQPVLKKTKKRLQQAATALTQYVHRLNGQPARNKLDPTLRQTFLDEGAPIGRDLKALRSAVRCPDDAPSM